MRLFLFLTFVSSGSAWMVWEAAIRMDCGRCHLLSHLKWGALTFVRINQVIKSKKILFLHFFLWGFWACFAPGQDSWSFIFIAFTTQIEMQLLEEPDLGLSTVEGKIDRGRKKAQHPGKFKHTTPWSWGVNLAEVFLPFLPLVLCYITQFLVSGSID